jgi:tetratricopeptide (TPR) repeat protein
MPVSKKPRRKMTPKAPPKRPATPAMPDLRGVESFLAGIGGQRGDDAIARAQDVMYDAWDEANPRKRIALARKALDISPLCADAYVLLAEEAADSIEQASAYYAEGVKAGELAIGPEGFQEYAGQFWGFLETRPYMRARAGLALALLKRGDADAAIGHFRAMLALNPGDNQGIRYNLAACLLRRNELAALNELLTEYSDEASAFWLYTRTLLAFREAGPGDSTTIALAEDAWSANEHVPAMLAGEKRPVVRDDGYITFGGPDEATDYVSQCGAAWLRTPGAVAWLTETVAALPKKRPLPRTTR